MEEFDPLKFGAIKRDSQEEFDPTKFGGKKRSPGKVNKIMSSQFSLTGPHNESWLKGRLGSNLIAGLLEAGQQVGNKANKFVNELGRDIPHEFLLGKAPQYNLDFAEKMGLKNNIPDKFVREAAPFIVTPEIRGPALIENLLGNRSLLQKGMHILKPSLNRGLPQVATASLVNENPSEGAINTSLGQILGESLPVAGRLAKRVGETIIPKKYTEQLGQEIFNKYKDYTKQASDLYNSVMRKHGNTIISKNPESLLGFSEEEKKYLLPLANKLYGNFKNEPNLENLHKFQSQLFKDANRLHQSPEQEYAAQALDDLRDRTKYVIFNHLKRDEHALKDYKEAAQITREKKKPFEVDPTISKIIEGHSKTLDLSPDEMKTSLVNAITNRKNDQKIMDKHYFTDALQGLNNKINTGEAMPIPWGKKVAKYTGNPVIEKASKSLTPYYQALKNAIIANIVSRNRNENEQ